MLFTAGFMNVHRLMPSLAEILESNRKSNGVDVGRLIPVPDKTVYNLDYSEKSVFPMVCVHEPNPDKSELKFYCLAQKIVVICLKS